MINIAITNLSVIVLTGIAGQLGRDTALGYAMGARLEYVLQPVAFGFGTAIVAMVGTNWGARQYRRAREIAWTGATTVAVVCGTIGLIVAFQPGLWIGLFSDDAEVARLGTLYLRIVGPAYICFGLGLDFYVSQGVGRGVAAMNANAVRMVASAAGGFVRYLLVRSRRRRILCRSRGGFLRLRGDTGPRSVRRENTNALNHMMEILEQYRNAIRESSPRAALVELSRRHGSRRSCYLSLPTGCTDVHP